MNPYLTAHALYTAAHRDVSWTDALDFHLQHGAVISTSDLFLMARPVCPFWEDEKVLDLVPLGGPSRTWHIWAVAGDLLAMLCLAKDHHIHLLTFQRHGQPRTRRRDVDHLHRIARAQREAKETAHL